MDVWGDVEQVVIAVPVISGIGGVIYGWWGGKMLGGDFGLVGCN